MSSGFVTRVEHDKYEPYTVIFTTDDERKYRAIEDACRCAIGHGKPQFQEVVRCNDCKWFDGENCCEKIGIIVIDAELFYCANGKRRSNGNKSDH